MPQLNPHRTLTLTGERWLVHLADPAQRVAAPAGFPDVREVDALLAAAERHGVLPAVTRALAARLEEHGECRLRDADTFSATLRTARRKVANQTGFGLLLSHHAGNVVRALSGADIAAAILKGASFARRLYPDAALRTFTDVDVLIPEARREDAARVMRNLGFELLEIEDRRGKDYQEQKWVLPMHRDVMIELHSNLVHSPKLRGAMSIRYEDVLAAGEGDSNAPTALLLVGAAHAAVGHQCDRLQHLVDIVQAVRGAAGAVDQERLARVARRCGAALAVAAAIDLGGRTINEPVATELARRVLPGRLGRLPGRILTPGLVLRAQSGTRARGSWRRKIFRQVLGAGVA
jgi:hypothetical protein